jgi:CBS domain containing-hemolysin-like protein
MKTLIFVILALVFFASVLLDKARRTVSVKELRRRARGGKNANNSNLYKLVAHGESLKLFLWLAGGISGAILFINLAGFSESLTVIALLLAAWLVLGDRPLDTEGFFWKLAGLISTPTLKIVGFLHPVLVRFTKLFSKLRPIRVHTGLYDKDDLLDLINTQNRQLDNRVPDEDLKIAFGSLTFGDKLVRDVMIPRHEIKFVAATDTVGPLLMDELHASGFSRFPVVEAPTKEANPKVIGTLYLKDLLDHSGKGRVKDVMRKGANFINESQTLREALNAFLKTQHHLLVVVNNFEEIAGIISLEDVMEQILGQKIMDEFDRYEDLRAVAEHDAKKEHNHHTA